VAALLVLPLLAASSFAADTADDAVAAFRAAARAQAAAAAAERKAEAASAPAPEAGRKVDLLPQFADPSTRNQGGIGSCHAFGSVAVLEAAYYRSYKEHVALAEEDVFLRRTVLSGDVYREFCSGGKCVMAEGNDPAGDIRYVLDHGALTGGSYVRFADRYVKYRDAEQKTMEGIQRTYEEMGWLEKLFYDPRAHWKELSTQAESKRLLTRYLEGKGSAESLERGRIQKRFEGFRLRSKDYGYSDENKKRAPADCLAKGAAQRAALKGELDAHRPVCVSMSLSGLASWGQTDATRDANHAFMIIGYDAAPGGKLVFHTRNSWGGQNPDIPEDQACRIYELDSVLAPGEKETF
jgi:hypothetical protein